MNLKKVWQSRNEILEGIKNNVFKKEAVEAIATERMNTCKACTFFDVEGSNCYVKGTQPCCGSCGCSLQLKVRSLSSSCPEGKWEPVLTESEEDKLDSLNSKN